MVRIGRNPKAKKRWRRRRALDPKKLNPKRRERQRWRGSEEEQESRDRSHIGAFKTGSLDSLTECAKGEVSRTRHIAKRIYWDAAFHHGEGLGLGGSKKGEKAVVVQAPRGK